jgi:hypothetical protein
LGFRGVAEAEVFGLDRVKPAGPGCASGGPWIKAPAHRASRPDRLLAAQLHQRGGPLEAVENALVLVASRRLTRPADAPPLGVIRSLAYFSPVIEEVLQLDVSPEYFRYLRHGIARIAAAR